jgi:glycosyltransferase involved in cell wall biosynthesis
VIQISFVIPCKNEETYISRCLESILNQPSQELVEVIVVDNGSSDSSAEIVRTFGDRVTLECFPGGSISAVRNRGAELANGAWLVFVDGDVEIAPNWTQCFQDLIQRIETEGRQVLQICTGSTCTIPNDPTWIESAWFGQLRVRDENNHQYINSGHLVISRELFESVNGFDPEYSTGEDEKLCADVIEKGGILLKENSLVAIHHGYPKSYVGFFRRERWHGKGLKSHLKASWKYRDLQLALYNWCLLVGFSIGAIIFGAHFLFLGTVVVLFFLPLFLFSLFRTRFNLRAAVPLTALWVNYGVAKSVALMDIFRDWVKRKFT